MQQYLPLAVLKLIYNNCGGAHSHFSSVATVLTACGIETAVIGSNDWRGYSCNSTYRLRYWNEQGKRIKTAVLCFNVLLQQYLPLAVLKQLFKHMLTYSFSSKLQQYLPLAVLKHRQKTWMLSCHFVPVATVLTACGIETKNIFMWRTKIQSCNSTYRLRYWNSKMAFATRRSLFVATVLTACGIETL